MKKIKWENIITLLIGGTYLHHTLNIQFENIGFMLSQIVVIVLVLGTFHQVIKATRKGHTLKAIKEMFID